MSAADSGEPAPRAYWQDAAHERLRVSFIDAACCVIQEMGTRDFPAPLNADSRAPVSVHIEVVHSDGCSKKVGEYPVGVY